MLVLEIVEALALDVMDVAEVKMLGTGEIILIFITILIMFGPKKVPKLIKEIGKTVSKLNEQLEKE